MHDRDLGLRYQDDDMPSVSGKQARMMRAIANGWKPPKESGIKIPVGVAKEFAAADKAKGGILNRASKK